MATADLQHTIESRSEEEQKGLDRMMERKNEVAEAKKRKQDELDACPEKLSKKERISNIRRNRADERAQLAKNESQAAHEATTEPTDMSAPLVSNRTSTPADDALKKYREQREKTRGN